MNPLLKFLIHAYGWIISIPMLAGCVYQGLKLRFRLWIDYDFHKQYWAERERQDRLANPSKYGFGKEEEREIVYTCRDANIEVDAKGFYYLVSGHFADRAEAII